MTLVLCSSEIVTSFLQRIVDVMRRRMSRRLAKLIVFCLSLYVVGYLYLIQHTPGTWNGCPHVSAGSWPADNNADIDDEWKTNEMNVVVDKKWVAKRKKLIAANVKRAAEEDIDEVADDGTTAPASTARIVIVGYMRGGTTLFGEIFNRNYEHLLWYEPLDSLYMALYGFDVYSNPISLLYDAHDGPFDYQTNFTRRNTSDYERTAIVNFFRSLLLCDVPGIPVETFAHPLLYQSTFFRPIYHCLERFDAIRQMIDCKRRTRIAAACSTVELHKGDDIRNRRRVDIAERRRCADAIAWFRSTRPKIFDNATETRFAAAFGGIDFDSDVSDRPETTTATSLTTIVDNQNSTTNVTRKARRVAAEPWSASKAFFNHYRCIDTLESAVGQSCVRPAVSKCRRARLITVEVVRAAMTNLDRLVNLVPDIQLVHYVRDPRAIAVSRAVNVKMTLVGDKSKHDVMHSERHTSVDADPIVVEARLLCARMLDDIRARRRLEIRYPGAVSVVRYEDLVFNPNETLSTIVDRIDKVAPGILDQTWMSSTQRWLRAVMKASVESDAYSIQRTNGRATAKRWMTHINYRQAAAMNRYCRRVLIELGYEI